MKTLIRVLGFVLLFGPLPCVLAQIATPIHGVIIADDYDIRITKYLNQVLPALTGLSVTPSVRTVFHSGGRLRAAGRYSEHLCISDPANQGQRGNEHRAAPVHHGTTCRFQLHVLLYRE